MSKRKPREYVAMVTIYGAGKMTPAGRKRIANVVGVMAALDVWQRQLSVEVGMIIHGDCSGVDRIAGRWARTHGIAEVRVPAQWEYHEDAAGPIRNQWMLDLNPDLVLAFPGGTGTAGMKRLAQRARIPVEEMRL